MPKVNVTNSCWKHNETLLLNLETCMKQRTRRKTATVIFISRKDWLKCSFFSLAIWWPTQCNTGHTHIHLSQSEASKALSCQHGIHCTPWLNWTNEAWIYRTFHKGECFRQMCGVHAVHPPTAHQRLKNPSVSNGNGKTSKSETGEVDWFGLIHNQVWKIRYHWFPEWNPNHTRPTSLPNEPKSMQWTVTPWQVLIMNTDEAWGWHTDLAWWSLRRVSLVCVGFLSWLEIQKVGTRLCVHETSTFKANERTHLMLKWLQMSNTSSACSQSWRCKESWHPIFYPASYSVRFFAHVDIIVPSIMCFQSLWASTKQTDGVWYF